MGSASNKFVFDKKKYTDILKEQIKINTINTNQDELKIYRCMIDGHKEASILFVCTNISCNANCRMVCQFCVRDELHLRDNERVVP